MQNTEPAGPKASGQHLIAGGDPKADAHAVVSWPESGSTHNALWISQSGLSAPKRVVVADDRMPADVAFRLASEGNGLLWRGDFQNARQLLVALGRRVSRKPPRPATSPAEAFRNHRQSQGQRARTLNMLLIPFEPGHQIKLRRAPNASQALDEAYGPINQRYVASLRELLGLIGAHEWRKKGVAIEAIGGRIHPHYGVFAPIRSEYISLVERSPLPDTTLAFDIGTGTGVLAAVLARRGVKHVVATDIDARAIACANDNIERLGLVDSVEVLKVDLFPPGQAPLIVCNPPWVPARPTSPLEEAIYDPQSRMLFGFLSGLAAHLTEGGEGWLILSDIAEHLGLRTRLELTSAIEKAGLKVIGRAEARPNHPKATDGSDPLYAARAAEITSLWRLARA
jgi:methylase of polypeptide subunit release factors